MTDRLETDFTSTSQTPPPTPPITPKTPSIYEDFGSSSSSDDDDHHQQNPQKNKKHPQDHLDSSALRRTHNTTGYRDGISASKSRYLQDGFDEGYDLGARLGLRVGWIKGLINGLSTYAKHTNSHHQQPQLTHDDRQPFFLQLQSTLGTNHSSQQVRIETDSDGNSSTISKKVKVLKDEIERELAIEKVFGREFFDASGVWRYPVVRAGLEEEQEQEQGEGKEDFTFDEVVEAHPLLQRYTMMVKELAEEFGLNVEPEIEAADNAKQTYENGNLIGEFSNPT